MHGLPDTAPDGSRFPSGRAHAPHAALTAGPFTLPADGGQLPRVALRYAKLPVKQAVISPALSLMYPAEGSRATRAISSRRSAARAQKNESGAVCAKGGIRCRSTSRGRLAVKIDPTATAQQLRRR